VMGIIFRLKSNKASKTVQKSGLFLRETRKEIRVFRKAGFEQKTLRLK
jgi:hypothetical protein